MVKVLVYVIESLADIDLPNDGADRNRRPEIGHPPYREISGRLSKLQATDQ